MQILIIEDRREQARLIQKIIQKNSKHQVMCCEDAFDGFAIIKALSSLDVVILDNELPFANGKEFLQKLKSTESLKNVPVVMITANDDYDSFKDIGADFCLHKPFSRDDIMNILDQIEDEDL